MRKPRQRGSRAEQEENEEEVHHMTQSPYTLDDVLNGNFKSDFQDVQQTIDEIERLADEQAIIGK